MADFKSFARQKHQWLSRVMHDGRLSAQTRLVAFEIFSHLNNVSGDAWPSQETIRANLGFSDVKAVKRGVHDLKARNYLEVTLDTKTRSNSYRPVFPPDDGDVLSPSKSQNRQIDGDVLSPSRGQNRTFDGDVLSPNLILRNNHTKEPVPHDPLRASWATLQSGQPRRESSRRGSVLDALERIMPEAGYDRSSGSYRMQPGRQVVEAMSPPADDDLRPRPTDGAVHVQLSEELGEDVIDRLVAMDGGLALKRLTARRRRGPLTEGEMAEVRLVANQRGGR